MRAEDGSLLGAPAGAAPGAAESATAASRSGTAAQDAGFWRRQSGLTWGLLGAVVAIVGLFAMLLLSPDPGATATTAAAPTTAGPAPGAAVPMPTATSAAPSADGRATIAQRKAELLTPVPPEVLAIAIEAVDAVPAEAWIDDTPRGSDRTVAQSEVFIHFDDRFTNRLLMQQGKVFEDLNALLSAVIAAGKADTAAKASYLLATCIDSEKCASFVWDSRTDLLTRAADGGVPAAMAALAEAYFSGDELLTRSLPMAESWLDKARAKCNSWVFPDIPQFSLKDHPLGPDCPAASIRRP
jgi:hypothetical protein